MTPDEIEEKIRELTDEIELEKDAFLAGIDRPLGNNAATHARALQRQITALENQLKATIAKYRDETLPQIYNDAVDEIYRDFTTRELPMQPPGSFAAIHGERQALLAQQMTYNTGLFIAEVGRNIRRYLSITDPPDRDDLLRFKSLEAIQAKFRDGMTIGQTHKLLVDNLKAENFDTITYSGPIRRKGMEMPVESYAAMVARSTSREAGNAAREEQLTANGYDLVQLTEHHPTCRLCAKLQGRVFSISGKDKRFPPLKTAFPDGYHNIHPNCRHSAVPYIEEFTDPEELAADIKRSNESLDIDPRDQAERDLYNKQQADNRRRSPSGRAHAAEVKARAQARAQARAAKIKAAAQAKADAAKARAAAKKAAAAAKLKAAYPTKKPSATQKPRPAQPATGKQKYLTIKEHAEFAKKHSVSREDLAKIWDQNFYKKSARGGYLQGGNSWVINQKLRGVGKLRGATISAEFSPEDQATIDALDRATTTRQSPVSFTGLRGVEPDWLVHNLGIDIEGDGYGFDFWNADHQAQVVELVKKKTGTIITDKAFTSMSTNPKRWQFPDSGVHLDIQVPEGAHGWFSPNIDEAEFVLPRNTRFKVVSAEPETLYKGTPDARHQVKITLRVVEEIPPAPAPAPAEWKPRTIIETEKFVQDAIRKTMAAIKLTPAEIFNSIKTTSGSNADTVHGFLNTLKKARKNSADFWDGELFRGVTGGPDFVEQFKTGELYNGSGVFGNGSYFSPFKGTALDYCNGEESQLIHATLRPDAHVVKYADLWDDWNRWDSAKTRRPFGTVEDLSDYILDDIGRFAEAHGYDAIILDGYSGENHVIVLNRAALIVRR